MLAKAGAVAPGAAMWMWLLGLESIKSVLRKPAPFSEHRTVLRGWRRRAARLAIVPRIRRGVLRGQRRSMEIASPAVRRLA